MKGGFGRRLDAHHVRLYRKEWLEQVQRRRAEPDRGSVTTAMPEVERRRGMIEGWRRMVQKVHSTERLNRSVGINNSTLSYLEGRAPFESLVPYLAVDERQMIYGRVIDVPVSDQSEMSQVMRVLSRAITRLETEWGIRI